MICRPGDQRIVDLPLPLEFVFVVVFLGESRFHLLERLSVHLGRVHMAADEFGPTSSPNKTPTSNAMFE